MEDEKAMPCAFCKNDPYRFDQRVGVPIYRCETISPKKCPGVWLVAVPVGDWNNHQAAIESELREAFEAAREKEFYELNLSIELKYESFDDWQQSTKGGK